MKLEIEIDFELGSIVYLKTGNSDARVINAVLIRHDGGISYNCVLGDSSNYFQACELTKDKSFFKKIGF